MIDHIIIALFFALTGNAIHNEYSCKGTLPTMINGAASSVNDSLAKQALGNHNKGGVCEAAVFKTTNTIKVYRVYDTSRPGTVNGRWWSLTEPSASKDQYRIDNAICPEWSKLDSVVECNVKLNEEFVVGTTQSVQCESVNYPKNSNLQLYIPNEVNNLKVENCKILKEWK